MENHNQAETKIQIIPKWFEEFCTESTVHGVRYIMEAKRHWVERIWWAVALTVSTFFCIFVILNIWTHWNDHPVITTFDDKTTPISNIPFPALTICPARKYFVERTSFNAEELNNIIDEVIENPSAILKLTPLGIASDLLTVEDNPSATHWNRENGYQSNIDQNKLYPYFEVGAGYFHSLAIDFRVIQRDMNIAGSETSEGYAITLHMPDELNLSMNDFVRIGHNMLSIFSVKPQVTVTSDGLRKYAPHKRSCYFQTERRLRFFKLYRQKNCELECLANFTLNFCNCVRYYMPRHNDTKICTILTSSCTYTAYDRFSYENQLAECDCIPDCISVNYDLTTSQIPYYETTEWTFTYPIGPNHRVKVQFSKIEVSFKESFYISIIRSGSSTISDFIANIGGLLGLFMGISLLSIVEIIYFITVRAWFKWKHREKVCTIAQTWATNSRLKMFPNQQQKQRIPI